mmetsp:Transcript_37477/g.66767  ORF Transcript_37477/g.66767 Transcript_37477/m.66767 type:complete len:81 (-) Transcript_37477:1316-1558(-)
MATTDVQDPGDSGTREVWKADDVRAIMNWRLMATHQGRRGHSIQSHCDIGFNELDSSKLLRENKAESKAGDTSDGTLLHL